MNTQIPASVMKMAEPVSTFASTSATAMVTNRKPEVKASGSRSVASVRAAKTISHDSRYVGSAALVAVRPSTPGASAPALVIAARMTPRLSQNAEKIPKMAATALLPSRAAHRHEISRKRPFENTTAGTMAPTSAAGR